MNLSSEWKHPVDFIGNAGPDKDTQLTKIKEMYIKHNAMKTDNKTQYKEIHSVLEETLTILL